MQFNHSRSFRTSWLGEVSLEIVLVHGGLGTLVGINTWNHLSDGKLDLILTIVLCTGVLQE